MRVIYAPPPNFDELDRVFKIGSQRVIFAWGDTIYNPHHIPIPPHLYVHERTHGRRQGKDIEGWWRRYIDDAEFRLAEEVPAHAAEYSAACRVVHSGEARRRLLQAIAERLSDPLYGSPVAIEEARRMVLRGFV